MTESLAVPLLVVGLDLSPLSLGVIAALSLAIGVLSGMVGMSLCVMRLPLMLAFGIDPLFAAGTNLAVGVVSGVTATWPHYKAGRVILWMVVFMGTPSVVGSFVGGRFAHMAPTWLLLGLVALFLAITGAAMVARGIPGIRQQANSSVPAPEEDAPLPRSRLYAGALVGLVLGLVGGAVGAILGTVRVPALVTIVRMAPARAVGTATVVGILAGMFGFGGHLLSGHMDWPLLGVMGSTAMVGSFAGARLVGRLNPRHLTVLLGVIVIAMVPLMLYEAVSEFST